MNTVAYKCPCCGAPLAYSGASGRLECASCGNSYDMEAIEAMTPDVGKSGVQFELPEDIFQEDDAQAMQAYVYKSCGAELMTEGTTTATECPYCGSPHDPSGSHRGRRQAGTGDSLYRDKGAGPAGV